MLRTRSTKGEVAVLGDDVRFLEICDADGLVAKLIYRDDAGIIHTIDSRDSQAARYAKTFGVKFCPVVRLPKT